MPDPIEVQGLTRRFGSLDAVENLDLTVPSGSIFALVGPNGAGKTTTIKLLMNLLRPTRGTATVLGTDSRRLGPSQFQQIGYVSENQRLPDWMTPGELLAHCRPLYPNWDDRFCRRLAKSLGLEASARLRSLSRGTRMKAALLASLAFRPELIVLDEPFTGLDPVVRDELIHALLETPSDHPLTVLVSSHDIEEVERLADWVGFLDRGRLVFAEPVASLLNRFRLIEVISPTGETPHFRPDAGWVLQGSVARMLRFVDTQHTQPGSAEMIASAYPGAEIRVSPLSLREIFAFSRSVSRRAPACGPRDSLRRHISCASLPGAVRTWNRLRHSPTHGLPRPNW
jgi:ABC-2 type transport system ATP-binding protein